MNYLFLIGALFLISISATSFAYAQSTYDVKIPTGAASPDAPYFWQSVKDGSTDGHVDILVGDTITWKNADTATHTVTSGTATDGPDGLFDSGLFAPGQSFSFTYDDIGDYPYYCIVHPWMEGTIFVTAGYSIIPNVGKSIGDGNTHFDVEYKFNRLLANPEINQDQKSITFEIVGQSQSDDHSLELRLPSKLIDGNFILWVDGEKISDYEQVKEGDLNTLFIELTKDSKILTITGTSIVPEFGSMAMIIFGISIVSMLVLSQKNRIKF
ncbi:PEFG-CTERM sorting domain-containing protein [Nitrosopumilus sp.]|uniref:PEFG-CTERM sorting domain-containing protein n=1 Tax=Nitrosopumilus sp. TaxID=2024843 RepID=UPI00247E1030|nr:PEFG-CTERM sorting domain-containing protein [Nitrosopumilus sp.]MCV0429958.1 PEFG-CTERM sorting domain-containing protein [Nitrosopumilus sp.]